MNFERFRNPPKTPCRICGDPSQTMYCGNKCRLRSFPHESCGNCGNPFIGKKDARFCSRSCYMIKRNADDPDLARNAAYKSAAIQKTRRGSGKGYIKEDGVHQHRLVAEKILGRPLHKKEIVHHKDHNKQNNDPSNLEITTQSDHIKIHHKEMMEARKQKHGY